MHCARQMAVGPVWVHPLALRYATGDLAKAAFLHKICFIGNSLPNTIDEATPMKPKKAAEEGHVSRLRVLIFAEGWSCLTWLERKEMRVPREV